MKQPEKFTHRPPVHPVEPPESGAVNIKLHVFPDANAVACEAAAFIARYAHQAVKQRGRFVLALSGGSTPGLMFKQLAQQSLPWAGTHVVQTDERVAPVGDAVRNLTLLQESLLTPGHLLPQQLYAMPVESGDLPAAARRYAGVLDRLGGSPPVLDLVHLGLGPDGHCASLVPGDPVLHIMDADVALTGFYEGRHRMTLTYPVISRARCVLWLVTGAVKADMLARLAHDDTTIPAGRINRERAVIFADEAAAAHIES